MKSLKIFFLKLLHGLSLNFGKIFDFVPMKLFDSACFSQTNKQNLKTFHPKKDVFPMVMFSFFYTATQKSCL